jgi:hypothetical protein
MFEIHTKGGTTTYSGSHDDLTFALEQQVGPGVLLAGAAARHNEIMRTFAMTAGKVTVVHWTKYGLRPGVRMVVLAKSDAGTWRIDDESFIPTGQHKVVTTYTDGTRPDASPNTRATVPSGYHK